ncbi:MAG: ACT domain-containing protein [Christensenellaceae bacterium]|jgi:ACT domain-containing protein|nr:ACT domain-containing protein [Christensenellaceae bacterium]
MENVKAFITVNASDRVGIIADIAVLLAKEGINIDDLSQTVLQGQYNMIMAVTFPKDKPFEHVSKLLHDKGKEIDLDIAIRHVDIFNAMHRI